MSIDDLIALLLAMPIGLAAQWGVWFAVGLGLSIWGRRDKNHAAYAYAEPEAAEPVKPKSGVRHARQAAAVATAPHSAGDAFGELEALLEPFAGGTHRTPGEASAAAAAAAEPVAASAPVLTEAPRLAAPQSLP